MLVLPSGRCCSFNAIFLIDLPLVVTTEYICNQMMSSSSSVATGFGTV